MHVYIVSSLAWFIDNPCKTAMLSKKGVLFKYLGEKSCKIIDYIDTPYNLW